MKGGFRRIAAYCTLGLLIVGTSGCAYESVEEQAPPDKVPITTSSEQAREAFLKGRDLFEMLRNTDAREYYREAVGLDPDFALAHLAMANTSPTAQEFWDAMGLAVAAAANASEGERHLVLAADAAARGDATAQLEHLDALAETFPQDERVHNVIGGYHFGRQEYDRAIEHYQKAITINPEFSQPYNQLGYAHRFLGNYGPAEEAFKKYIELIPDEPNPYDSYAELLMKMGRYEESIEQYRLALEKNPTFVASFVGIGNNHMFMGQSEEARQALEELSGAARNTGERRQAMLWTAASYLHEGRADAAIESVEEMYRVAETTGDLPTMAGDLTLMGNILLETGSAAGALAKYQESVKLMQEADVPDDNKQNATRNHLFFETRVALANGELDLAEEKARAYGELVQAHQLPFEMRRHQELLGHIALERGDYATALEHLGQANLRNPRVLYLTALAHEASGDSAAAREACERAANFNELNFNYALIRKRAQEMLDRQT